MELADSITGYALLGIPFIVFTIMNYYVVLLRIKKAQKIPEPVPFIGGITGVILFYVIFRFKYPLLLVLPLIIDPGSIPLIIWFLICYIKDVNRK